jgi:hypothetical protein
VHIPDCITVVVPGQQWLTYWDSLYLREPEKLPDRYVATVEFCDSRGRNLDPLICELDWKPLRERGHLVVYGEHQAAGALRDISREMKRWSESGSLRVLARSGERRDQWARTRVGHTRPRRLARWLTTRMRRA